MYPNNSKKKETWFDQGGLRASAALTNAGGASSSTRGLPQRTMSEPVFGLRWIPDGSLRPLRYLPSPQQRAAAAEPDLARDVPPAPSPLQQTQHLRLLTQRLADAEESVRQRSEQIRWLKEMTKDDTRRARVSRWMSGPLLRVFAAWKRCVRESVRSALAVGESASRAAR